MYSSMYPCETKKLLLLTLLMIFMITRRTFHVLLVFLGGKKEQFNLAIA